MPVAKDEKVILLLYFLAAGNFLNSPMFKRGPACSACPSGTSCSVENPGKRNLSIFILN